MYQQMILQIILHNVKNCFKKPYKLQIGLSVKKSITKNIWPNFDIDMECIPNLEFVTMHPIQCIITKRF